MRCGPADLQLASFAAPPSCSVQGLGCRVLRAPRQDKYDISRAESLCGNHLLLEQAVTAERFSREMPYVYLDALSSWGVRVVGLRVGAVKESDGQGSNSTLNSRIGRWKDLSLTAVEKPPLNTSGYSGYGTGYAQVQNKSSLVFFLNPNPWAAGRS